MKSITESIKKSSSISHSRAPWSYKHIPNEAVKGAKSTKIYSKQGTYVVGKINATHKKEGSANLRVILESPRMYDAMKQLVQELESINYTLPAGGDKLTDKVLACKEIINSIEK